MSGITTHWSARILVGIIATTLLAGCVPDQADGVVDDASAAPVADPDPDGNDADGGVVGERPPKTHDWDDAELDEALSDGWRLRDCDGDAPLRCLHGPDGSVRGVVELLRFEEHEGLVGAYDVDRVGAALHGLVDDFEAWLIDDREAACPRHRVELEPREPVAIAGMPAHIRGHRMLSPQGDPVERSLVAYIADGGDLVLVTVVATAPGSCTHAEELGDLTPAEFDHLREDRHSLLLRGSVPRADRHDLMRLFGRTSHVEPSSCLSGHRDALSDA